MTLAYPGTEWRFKAEFRRNDTRNVADPTTITLKVKAPDNVITSYVYGTDALVVKEGTGKYYRDIELTKAGTYHWQWIGDGDVEAVKEGQVKVRESQFS